MAKKSSEEALLHALYSGPQSGKDLQRILGISQSRLSQLVGAQPDVKRFGGKRNSIYARHRTIEGHPAQHPIYRVSTLGEVEEVGQLQSISERGFIVEGPDSRFQVFPGLPYFTEDLRPQGYLGRIFTQRHPELELPRKIEDWTDNHTLTAITSRGEDLPGNLIIGKKSLESWLSKKPAGLKKPKSVRYGKIAENLLGEDIGGSSAGGEHPKFTTERSIVKFSPKISTPSGARWADLLAAESIALTLVGTKNRYFLEDDRAFLEVERFDRTEAGGRVGVISLFSIVHEYLNSPRNWSQAAENLLSEKIIDPETRDAILFQEALGMLIGNDDRHFGNLSFFSDFLNPSAKLKLTPTYDLLPMTFRPRNEERLPDYSLWSRPTPTPETIRVWKEASRSAKEFWSRVADSSEISKEFKAAAKNFARD
ncbi:MAG: HipA domain-containing protein [Cryobacterium sp.]|nr:HipA domain-containing protein [Oligoflexia bacterium]